MMAMIIYY